MNLWLRWILATMAIWDQWFCDLWKKRVIATNITMTMTYLLGHQVQETASCVSATGPYTRTPTNPALWSATDYLTSYTTLLLHMNHGTAIVSPPVSPMDAAYLSMLNRYVPSNIAFMSCCVQMFGDEPVTLNLGPYMICGNRLDTHIIHHLYDQHCNTESHTLSPYTLDILDHRANLLRLNETHVICIHKDHYSVTKETETDAR